MPNGQKVSKIEKAGCKNGQKIAPADLWYKNVAGEENRF